MSEKELRGTSPRSFSNKLEGFQEKDRKEWERAVFVAIQSGNSMFYKKPLKEKDFKSLYSEMVALELPTKENTEWMDRHFGREL